MPHVTEDTTFSPPGSVECDGLDEIRSLVEQSSTSREFRLVGPDGESVLLPYEVSPRSSGGANKTRQASAAAARTSLLAVRLLPRADRSRYAEEWQAELLALAEGSAHAGVQWAYATRLLAGAPRLWRELHLSARGRAGVNTSTAAFEGSMPRRRPKPPPAAVCRTFEATWVTLIDYAKLLVDDLHEMLDHTVDISNARGRDRAPELLTASDLAGMVAQLLAVNYRPDVASAVLGDDLHIYLAKAHSSAREVVDILERADIGNSDVTRVRARAAVLLAASANLQQMASSTKLQSMPTVSLLARSLANAAVRLLPPADRSRYAEEYRSELHELAALSRRAYWAYVVRVLTRSLSLRRELCRAVDQAVGE